MKIEKLAMLFFWVSLFLFCRAAFAAERVEKGTRVVDVIDAPAFAGFGRFL